jgi:alkylation response protein AidB-like acyl-CoA dehydrogenase
MTDVLIDRPFLDFVLHRWLGVEALAARPAFADLDRATMDAMVDAADLLARDHFLPHYKLSDRIEPRLADGKVEVLPEIGAALAAFAEAGLFSAPFPAELGGLGVPNVVYAACMAHAMAANIATSAYPMLSTANARLLCRFGSPAQIEAFARPQIAGTTFGTMCLSEPQAGSSLGDIVTRAVPDGEDALGPRYRLFGNKMWISAADHEMSDTIVHLVLAKIVDASGRVPAGSRAISLFAVPKHLPVSGERNDVVVAGLNHKMGYRGTVNALLNFGEGTHHRPDGQAGAVGFLVGEPGQGLAIMFHMMNEARISVGLGAAALACRGYRLALTYAKERRQGRAPDRRDDPAQSPIVAHADVRRMLLAQKAYSEIALSLVLFCAELVDEEKTAPTPEQRAEASALLGLLTPLAKTWPSEWGLAANDLAIQVHGGYGYTRDFDVEQLYRDNRLNPIHEGTTGIQAADLLGRKVLKDKGAALGLLGREVAATVAGARTDPELAVWAGEMEAHWRAILDAAAELAGKDGALDHAGPFQSAFGHAVASWIALDQAMAARRADDLPASFVQGRVAVCAHMFAFEAPRIAVWLSTLAAGRDPAPGLDPDWL